MDARYAVNLHSDLAPIERPSVLKIPSTESVVYTSEANLDGDTWYRLRLGFFATESEAEMARDRLIDSYPRAWIVRVGVDERAQAADGN